jgi:hypothetical protein
MLFNDKDLEGDGDDLFEHIIPVILPGETEESHIKLQESWKPG